MKTKIVTQVTYGILFAVFLGLASANATVRTWTGLGADENASTPGNWLDNIAPDNGDSVLFDTTSSVDCHWDLDVEIADWTQTADYNGSITIRTVYPTDPPTPGAFTNLAISGNVTLSGGTWTHIANSGGNTAIDRLAVTVGGDFTLTAPAKIDVTERGFAGRGTDGWASGPGGGYRTLSATIGVGASHGGEGSYGVDAIEQFPNNDIPPLTYGSIVAPLMLGSGARIAGGGAVQLTVGGQLTLNGDIHTSDVGSSNRPGSAGGSVFIRAASIAGSGTINVRGVQGRHSGGGGRIAVVLNDGNDFDALQFVAAGNIAHASPYPPEQQSAAGTVYLEGVENESVMARLIVDNTGIDTLPGRSVTLIPSAFTTGAIEPHPALFDGKLAAAALRIDGQGQVRLMDHVRMRDLEWLVEDSRLDLNGFTLYFEAPKPSDFPELSEPSDDPVSIPVALGGGTIEPNGGRILWDDQPFRIALPIWSGPNGTIDNYDPDAFYDYGSDRTITAVPNAGFKFLRWLGAIPGTEDAFTPELTVPVIPETYLRAVFVSTAPDTYTWIGGVGSDGQADTAANWYPEGVPGNDDHIVLDGASYERLTWDDTIADFSERWTDWSLHSENLDWGLDIETASWTQSEHYTGHVLIRTHFPGQGTFSNLVVHGNCLIDGGILTHPANTGGDTETDRLSLKVGGDFRLGTAATLDVSGKGFADFRGPGKGVDVRREGGLAASHGGQGAYDSRDHEAPAATYGSITRPATLGSGGDGRGGGLVNIVATGIATIDGTILAHGQDGQKFSDSRYPASAGGSVYIQAAAIEGTGSISAAGGSGYYSAGGGRVALVATDALAMSQIDATALPGLQDLIGYGESDARRRGTPGTVFMKTPADAHVIIDARGLAPQSANPDDPPPILFTPLMPDIRPPQPLPWGPDGEVRGAKLVMRDEAVVGLTSDVRVRDLSMQDNSVRLRLRGYDLILGVTFHRNWGEEDWVVYDGGRIRWPHGTLMLLR